MPAAWRKRLVHGQEAAVAIDQRKADRKHVEQGLQVRRLAERRRVAAIEQQECARAALVAGIGRDMDSRAAARRLRPRRPGASDRRRRLRRGRRNAARCRSARRRPSARSANGRLAASSVPLRVDHRRHDSGGGEPLAGGSLRAAATAAASGSGDDGWGKRHSNRSPCAPTRSTSTALAPASVATPATQPRAVAPRHRSWPFRALAASSSRPRSSGGRVPPNRSR